MPEIPVAAATPPLRPLAPPVRAKAPPPATAALPLTWAGGAATLICPFPQPRGSPGGVPCGGHVPAVPPLPPEGNGTILTGPSPVPEIPVAAATSPLRPLAHSVRTMAPSLATATLPPPWAGGAVTPIRPFPQPLGSPGGIPCGGQVPAVPPLLPEGNGTIPTGPSPAPEIPVAAATPPHIRAALASAVHPAL